MNRHPQKVVRQSFAKTKGAGDLQDRACLSSPVHVEHKDYGGTRGAHVPARHRADAPEDLDETHVASQNVEAEDAAQDKCDGHHHACAPGRQAYGSEAAWDTTATVTAHQR